MPLDFINIYNARNLKDFSLQAIPTFNIIHGTNGSGKTTILESIYFLLRSRIFRNNKYKSFINSDSNECTIFSKFNSSNISKPHNNSFTIGIKRTKDSLQPLIHLNQKKIFSLSQISNLVLLGLICPESFNLLDSGPSVRRKFLDWGVFHVEHEFIDSWNSYKKILDNRNKILKKLKNDNTGLDRLSVNKLYDLNCWKPQLILYNNKLTRYRKNQLQSIKNFFFNFLKVFSESLSNNISINFYQGWSNNLSYEEYIDNKLSYDLSVGYTRYGSHRADIIINYNNQPANDILSRGQKKIIIICLILSQFQFLKINHNSEGHSLLLLDDMDSELDDSNLNKLFMILKDINTQVFATTTNKRKYHFIEENAKLFHVKHN
ncbi:MAG: DNA replication and repair protein RecF [gamma proteobacterium symbiont of Taylorina sp.]|nr:DNA replication and repair protein RecF [gamma proteobacterium symbiont of Taylorina sp.]